ncbi:MAG TPA: branched-chain amino acid aminotransferase [Clostridia bacterium]|nr:branched-chain amino acid aminotransferase [Clostridia bacterium]
MNISFTESKHLKDKPWGKALGFGKHTTDYMFIMDYNEENGWYDPKIVPYSPIPLDPSTCVLHYGQGVFEGLKAYKTDDGRILLFRPDQNVKRLNSSCDRTCIPMMDEDDVLEAIKALVKLEKDWIPEDEGTSLYIRPFVIATDPFLGVHPSHTYMFMIIVGPVGNYYPSGLNPVKIFVEDEYVRAAPGGTGTAKTMGNYAASLKAQDKAEKKGFIQVLWLDGVHRKYVEEVGAMNVFFKIDGKIVTPNLSGSILSGITRMSCIELLKKRGYDVEERPISIDELIEAHANGKLEESFGTGTAAVISPIGELMYKGRDYVINNGKIGEVTSMLYDTLTGIQFGRLDDEFGWTVEVI